MASPLTALEFYKAFSQRLSRLPVTTVYYLRVYESTAVFKEDLPTYMNPYGFRLKTHDAKLMTWLLQCSRKRHVASTFADELNFSLCWHKLTKLLAGP